MSQQPTPKPRRSLVRTALLTLVGLAAPLLLPGAARAACGDHVVLGEQARPVEPAPAPANDTPCPHCSQAPAPPPAVPPAPAAPTADLVCALACASGLAPPGACLLPPTEGRGAPIHLCFPPERPPRA